MQQALPLSEVQLWQQDLAVLSPAQLQLCAEFLTAGERTEKRTTTAATTAFRTSRGLLRLVLGAYLGVPPAAVPLEKTLAGKLQIGGSIAKSMAFSLSHSGTQWWLAVSSVGALGLDCEEVRSDAGRWSEEHLALVFHQAEITAIRKLPRPWQNAAFTAAWTAKEAVFKALGSGITAALQAVQVLTFPGKTSFLQTTRISRTIIGKQRVTVHKVLSPSASHVGALAVIGKRLVVRPCGDLSPLWPPLVLPYAASCAESPSARPRTNPGRVSAATSSRY